jgi:chromosome segregation ATPase
LISAQLLATVERAENLEAENRTLADTLNDTIERSKEARAEVERQSEIIKRLCDEKATQSMDFVKVVKTSDDLRSEVERLKGPQARAERAYDAQIQTAELNRKLRINGASIRDATIEDWKTECDQLRALLEKAEGALKAFTDDVVHWRDTRAEDLPTA